MDLDKWVNHFSFAQSIFNSVDFLPVLICSFLVQDCSQMTLSYFVFLCPGLNWLVSWKLCGRPQWRNIQAIASRNSQRLEVYGCKSGVIDFLVMLPKKKNIWKNSNPDYLFDTSGVRIKWISRKWNISAAWEQWGLGLFSASWDMMTAIEQRWVKWQFTLGRHQYWAIFSTMV